MAQQTYNLDWFSSNETVKYPLDSLASCIPTGYSVMPPELPGVITDISFALPSSIEDEPYLSALTITDDLLTLIICVGDEPLFVFSTTQSQLYVHRYYNLTPFVTGCSGVITFGNAAKTHRCAYKFSSPAESGFLPSVYHKYMAFPITGIHQKGHIVPCIGDIQFQGAGDVKVEVDTLTINGSSQKALVFGLDYSASEDTITRYLGPCDGRPESDTCVRTSIENINSATPVDGNIIIRGEGISIDTFDGRMTMSSGYTLDDVCVSDKIDSLIGEDYCTLIYHPTLAPEEPVVDSSSAANCASALNSVNFTNQVFGSDISIGVEGLTTLGEDEVTLTIPVLENLYYFSILIARPEEGGYCTFTYGQGQTEVELGSTEVAWGNQTIHLLDNGGSGSYPTQIEAVVDHCNGEQYVAGVGRLWNETCSQNEIASVTIKFKKCTIKQIHYK